ncbi:MAG: LD-carboxypeptidase [Lentisphaeria bacterium]|nr:LD-carboxypeptidase [Lentisphaeria bacterium]
MFKFPGDCRVALVSPSGMCDRDTVAAGKEMLEKCGCTVKIMPHVFDGGALPHLSAPDEKRAEDINQAVADENIDMLWAVRGGAGALRILNRIDWKLWQLRRTPLAGFSDITALHWAMAKFGVNTHIAAPMMKYLADDRDTMTAGSLLAAINGEKISLRLPALRPGEISGIPLAGNIAVAAALCGTGYLPDTGGKVLILEEVGESPYRIDRMLTQLLLAGVFERCAGIIFGNFTDCGEVPGVMDVLRDFTARVNCPVCYGLAHGHELPFFSVSGEQLISVTPR